MIRKFGIENPNYKGKVKLICPTCLKEFNVYPYKKNTAKYCSHKCFGEWRSKNLRGEKNPCWKGGITCKGQWIIRESIKLLGHNCQLCNASINVHTHHKDGNHKNNPLDGSNWQDYVVLAI